MHELKQEIAPDQAPALSVEGPVATITLRRPAQHNRIAPDDCGVICGHLAQLEDMPGVRALVLTGSGDKTFSSGYTLGAIKDQLDDRFENMLDRIEGFSLPTICMLNGSVYGGATDLALCCDFRIGVQGSRMFMPAARIGLHYYPGGIRRYVTVLGLAAAKKLFMTAQTIDDAEMLRIGFLHELVPSGQLHGAVRAYVEAILACAPGVLASMKTDLRAMAEGVADEAALRAHYAASLASGELADRLAGLAGKKSAR